MLKSVIEGYDPLYASIEIRKAGKPSRAYPPLTEGLPSGRKTGGRCQCTLHISHLIQIGILIRCPCTVSLSEMPQA